jgi:hypothetical protein
MIAPRQEQACTKRLLLPKESAHRTSSMDVYTGISLYLSLLH